MGADEAYAHGVVSRSCRQSKLDETVSEMRTRSPPRPPSREDGPAVLRHLSEQEVRSSMAEELIASVHRQVGRHAEFRAAAPKTARRTTRELKT